MYVLKFTSDALGNINALPKNVRNALKRELRDKVQTDPVRCSLELSEPLKGYRSFHFGKYRVVFRVYEDLAAIAVVGVGEKIPSSQSDIYKRLERLAKRGKLADTLLSTLKMFSNP